MSVIQDPNEPEMMLVFPNQIEIFKKLYMLKVIYNKNLLRTHKSNCCVISLESFNFCKYDIFNNDSKKRSAILNARI